MSRIISIQQVSKQYANHKALDNVSFDIKAGSIFGLLGPNGAGKTSLIRILNQITAPDAGQILFDGAPLNPSHQHQIGYLPEERGLYKKMKVGEQALYLAQLKGMHKKEAMVKLKYWFERFDIINWWFRRVEELSKGMQQKIQFITTVLHEPKLLIFDEPFTGFDPINVNLLREEMLRLKKQGSTLILSTHNMESVESLCDSIVLIDRSRKILEGPVQDIRRQYRQQLFSVQIENTNITARQSFPSTCQVVSQSNTNTTLDAVLQLHAGESANQLLQELMQLGQIKRFEEKLPTMHDIFIQAVKNNKHE